MDFDLDQLATSVLRLPSADRAQLAARLLASLAGPGGFDASPGPGPRGWILASSARSPAVPASTAVPSPPITTSPERLGGSPMFAGTRVPVQSLFDYLEGGDSLGVFLDQFPSVPREHAVAVLELAKRTLVAQAAAAPAAAA